MYSSDRSSWASLGSRGILSLPVALSAQSLTSGLSLFHPKMPSGPGDLRNMNVPSPHLEIGTCLIDVFHQDLTPFVYKGTFFLWQITLALREAGWGCSAENNCPQGKWKQFQYESVRNGRWFEGTCPVSLAAVQTFRLWGSCISSL